MVNFVYKVENLMIKTILLLDLIAFLKTKKIKFAAMVYDLLPFTNPRWFPVTRYKKIYAKWFDTISKLDCVFTISKTVKKN